jgi:superfamily II DNA helicase RecQ
MAKSTELNLPAYGVFSQKALYELVNYLPVDGKSLTQINGIGPKKHKQFGAEIIEIIRDYCEENEIKRQFIPHH